MNSGVLRTDGGARGNPGPAGAGFVLEDETGSVLTAGGRYLGETTNNVAEYEALLWGMEVAADMGVRRLAVYSDSELVVRQLKGQYKVKNAGLKPLYLRALELARRFESVSFSHVRREENAAADAMANAAMDACCLVGDAPEPGSGARQGQLF